MLFALLVLACVHHTPDTTVSVELDDVPPLLDAGARLVDAIPDDEAAGCIVTEAAAVSLRTAAAIVREATLGAVELPALSIDVSACGPMPSGVDVPAEVNLVLAALPLALAPVTTQVDCRAAAWLRASLTYVDSLAPAVVEELADPDGRVEVPGVVVDLTGC